MQIITKIKKTQYMKKILMVILTLMPLTLWAQANTWERPEEDETEKAAQKQANTDEKYLKGAVPEIDGKVVFSKTIEAPGKSAEEIYAIVSKYMDKMTKEKNQIHSLLLTDEAKKNEVVGHFEEWLVFKSNIIMLDQTRLYYILTAQCENGKVDLTMSRVQYLYEENRNPQRIKAEGWITDKEAVNKKNTKLYPLSGKFRRKTIDRKDFIFNKIESLLK